MGRGMLPGHPSTLPPFLALDVTSPRHDLPEWQTLERLIAQGGRWLQVRELGQVALHERAGGLRRLPLLCLTLGNPDPACPAVGLFGGVHGLERIGAEVVLGCLHHLVHRLAWDGVLQRQLEQLRLVMMPLVNPGGLARGTRANPNGVDLMRNAPLQAREPVPFLVGGQRLSAGLPWYRGPAGAPMELESQAVCRVVEEELLPRPFSLAIDCHSGFGLDDRIWFPYAHTRAPIEHLPELHALKELLDSGHLHHTYVFEPQSRQYLAHGDLWDHLYLQSLQRPEAGVFLPLTLEMGSWRWVKKNPRQLFSRLGLFNPMSQHRHQRVLRRHLAWLDLMTRAASSHTQWRPTGAAREQHRQAALSHWYAGDGGKMSG